MKRFEPTFWADRGPRYHHAEPGSGAHEVADHLTRSGTLPGDRGMVAAARWRRGAAGEEAVGARLDQLPRPDWVVVHDLTIGSRGANLDHLVLGPPRAFSINTKHLSHDVVVYGRAIFNGGRSTSYLPRAVQEAATVRRRLLEATGIDAHVWPVLVFHGCRVLIKELPKDVTILTSIEVPGWFVGQTRQRWLSASAITTLETAARASTTWPTPRPVLVPDAPPAPPPQPAITVTRWQRFGQDRWYVNLADGTTLGHLDARTGDVHVERPEDDSLVRAVLRRDGGPLP